MITQLALKIAWCYIFLAFQATFKWVMLLDSLYPDLYRYQNVRRKNKTNWYKFVVDGMFIFDRRVLVPVYEPIIWERSLWYSQSYRNFVDIFFTKPNLPVFVLEVRMSDF